MRDAVQRPEEVLPGRAFLGQDAAARRRDAIAAAPARPGALDPAALDEAAILEPVQRRIERRDVEAELALRPLTDQPADVVAVPGLVLDERQDQDVGAAGFLGLRRAMLTINITENYQ
jgi:hypothetical protein